MKNTSFQTKLQINSELLPVTSGKHESIHLQYKDYYITSKGIYVPIFNQI